MTLKASEGLLFTISSLSMFDIGHDPDRWGITFMSREDLGLTLGSQVMVPPMSVINVCMSSSLANQLCIFLEI